MAEDIKKIKEVELNKVSGGGWMDKYKDENMMPQEFQFSSRGGLGMKNIF